MFEKVKNKFAEMKTNFNSKMLTVPASAAALVTTLSVSSFASEGDGVLTELPTIVITEDMLTPLVDGVVSNIAAILPTGLGLMGLILGIRLIPGVISRLVRG